MPAKTRLRQAWKRPDRRRLRTIRDRLRAYYGRPRNEPHHAPLDELVLTILSQNTNDRNRDVAYARLRERFPSWEAVADAPARGGGGGDPARRHLEGQVASGSSRCWA